MITAETRGAPNPFARDPCDIILAFLSMDDHPPVFRVFSVGCLTGEPFLTVLSEEKPDFLINIPFQILRRSCPHRLPYLIHVFVREVIGNR